MAGSSSMAAESAKQMKMCAEYLTQGVVPLRSLGSKARAGVFSVLIIIYATLMIGIQVYGETGNKDVVESRDKAWSFYFAKQWIYYSLILFLLFTWVIKGTVVNDTDSGILSTICSMSLFFYLILGLMLCVPLLISLMVAIQEETGAESYDFVEIAKLFIYILFNILGLALSNTPNKT